METALLALAILPSSLIRALLRGRPRFIADEGVAGVWVRLSASAATVAVAVTDAADNDSPDGTQAAEEESAPLPLPLDCVACK